MPFEAASRECFPANAAKEWRGPGLGQVRGSLGGRHRLVLSYLERAARRRLTKELVRDLGRSSLYIGGVSPQPSPFIQSHSEPKERLDCFRFRTRNDNVRRRAWNATRKRGPSKESEGRGRDGWRRGETSGKPWPLPSDVSDRRQRLSQQRRRRGEGPRTSATGRRPASAQRRTACTSYQPGDYCFAFLVFPFGFDIGFVPKSATTRLYLP